MNRKLSLTLLIQLMLFSTAAFSQSEKNEVEDSISNSEMPEKALETLEEFWPDMSDIRFFAQTDGDEETFEAKLEWRGKSFSIEFTSDGNVIDVEQLVEMDEIGTSDREAIESYLESEFKRVRITRLQRQYIADDDDGVDDEDFIDDILEEDEEDYKIRYEIEVEGNTGSEIGAFELLFDQSGEIIQRRRIVRRSLDNIW